MEVEVEVEVEGMKMRALTAVFLGALGGCAASSSTYKPPESVIADFDRQTAALRMSNPELFTGRPIGPPLAPEERQKMEAAAIANVDAEMPQTAGGRRPAGASQAREQRISAEEARLSDAVEKRRRDRLEQREQSARSSRDQQAVYACRARGAQMEAAYYNPRSFLNLEATAAGNRAAQACYQAYQRTGIIP